jgi:hypothetical protein
MDLGGECGAVYWHPDDRTTHHSDSAEQVLRLHQRIGTARLTWLNPRGGDVTSPPRDQTLS